MTTQIVFGGKLATDLGGSKDPTAGINDLQERRRAVNSQKLDKILFDKIISVSTRIGGPEFLPEDGLKMRVSSGRTYYDFFQVENAYAVDGERLKEKGVKIIDEHSPLPFLKVAAESKSIIYVLYRKEGYAMAITPAYIQKLGSFPAIVDSLERSSHRTGDAGYH